MDTRCRTDGWLHIKGIERAESGCGRAFRPVGTIGTAWNLLWLRELLFDLWQLNGPPDYCELVAGTLVCR